MVLLLGKGFDVTEGILGGFAEFFGEDCPSSFGGSVFHPDSASLVDSASRTSKPILAPSILPNPACIFGPKSVGSRRSLLSIL